MLKLSIVTPEKKIVTDVEVSDLLIPTWGGEINVLEGHAALMTTLIPGILSFTHRDGEKSKVVVSWGYCEVADDKVNVLAETAERPEEVDLERAQAALKKTDEKLMSPDLDPVQAEKLRWKKERAMVRIAVSKMH